MLNRLPRQFPPLAVMLEDIGDPSARELAKTFGVSERTVKRWIAQEGAPVPVLIAIFWLTRWGMSQVEAEVHNTLTLNASVMQSQRFEIEALKRRLHDLGRIADFGAANDPAPGVPRLITVVPPGEAQQPAAPQPPTRAGGTA